MKKIMIVVLMLVMISGCVTQKKYNELLAEKVQLEGEKANALDSLAATVDSLYEYKEHLMQETRKYLAASKLEEETRNKLEELNGEHAKLETYYNNLLNNSGKLTKDFEEQRNRLIDMKEDLEQSSLENEKLLKDLQAREIKVRELEDILAKKDEAVNAIKSMINDALLNFKESDLTVSVKNGKVYVSLAEQLLFNSGSVIVDPKGKDALKKLAVAIKDQKDIAIMVEGHTDNIPIGRTSQYMNDNWDLSVMRATSIVRILVSAGLAPDQLVASGKGEFSPVDTNETPVGRSNNRRTEIVITPDLDELYRILEN